MGFTFNNAPPDKFDNSFEFAALAADQIDIAGDTFFDGPAWEADDLIGLTLNQYLASSQTIANSYTIADNGAISSDDLVTIDVGEDFDPWPSLSGQYYFILVDGEGNKYRLESTDLGSAGSPYTGAFKRVGLLPDKATHDFAFSNTAPDKFDW